MYNTQFQQLHRQDSPLLLGNVWDVNSALLFQKLGFKAIGTSSAAIATSLGDDDDGESIPFKKLLKIVQDIQEKIKIPLTVDIEGGYSRNVDIICKNIKSLANLNVAGINIEDSIVNDDRKILNTNEFCRTIREIQKYLSANNISIFVNVRTDCYIMGLDNPLEDTLKRVQAYEEAGANGIFVPCILAKTDINQVVKATSLPVNVMTMPNLPDFSELTGLGVKRISMGPFLYNNLMNNFEQTISTILHDQSFGCLF